MGLRPGTFLDCCTVVSLCYRPKKLKCAVAHPHLPLTLKEQHLQMRGWFLPTSSHVLAATVFEVVAQFRAGLLHGDTDPHTNVNFLWQCHTDASEFYHPRQFLVQLTSKLTIKDSHHICWFYHSFIYSFNHISHKH